MKLNLGCGRDIRKGYVNTDLIEVTGIDEVFDMNFFPYPFKDSIFEEIICNGVLDYLENPDRVMKEIWRIAKPKAKIELSVGHFSSLAQYNQLTNKRGFTSTIFKEYDIENENRNNRTHLLKDRYNDHVLFKVKYKLILPRIYKIIGVSFLANNFTGIYEEFFARIFPARRIYFELIIVK